MSGPSALYTMSEPAGSTQANDSSGNQRPALEVVGTGSAVTFGNTVGPTTDGLTAVSIAGEKYLRSAGHSIPMSAFTVVMWASAAYVASPYRIFLVDSGNFDYVATASGIDVTADGNAFVQWGPSSSVTLTGTPLTAAAGLKHLAITFTTTEVRYYVNGVLADSAATGATSSTFTAFQIGHQNVGSFPINAAAHYAMYTTALSPTRIADMYTAGTTGFAGETPAARLARYAAYAGVPASETSFETGDVLNLAHIDPTGRTALDVMREVETTENGVLFDAGDGTLKFHDRSHRYGLASAFTVSVAAGECAAALEPILDDQQLVNDMTTTGSSGITGRAKDDTSVTDYGPYRESLDLATSNSEEPLQAASWRVGRYAQPLVRVPGVEINLNSASTALTQAVLNAELGTRFTITGLPSNAPATSMDLFIEGMTETITADSHRISLRTSPASVYDVWILGDSTFGVLDTTTRLGY